MEQPIIMPNEAWRKLRFAYGLNTAVYMYGATGFGKTTIAEHFFAQTNKLHVLRFNGQSLAWELDQFEEAVRGINKPTAVLIDELHWLQDDQAKQQIQALIASHQAWVVLIGRTDTPAWLLPQASSMHLVVISEDDLRFSAKDVAQMAGKMHAKALSADEIEFIRSTSEGNAMVISMTLQRLMDGANVDQSLTEHITRAFGEYLECYVINKWNNTVQEFLMQMSLLDSFTLSMAEAVTGDDQAQAVLHMAMDAGHFLFREGDVYRIRPVLLETLRERALTYFGRKRVNLCLYNAAHYYEMQDDVLHALKLYEQCGDTASIRMLLIRNGRRNPGVGFYYELRNHYFALADEEILCSPVLMGAMSMLCDVLMDPDKSEYWYQQLKDYSTKHSGADRQEAMRQLLYLDMSLPHRGVSSMIDVMKRAPAYMIANGITLPQMSLTNNQPSLMNGGKDFCEWSKNDDLMAAAFGKLVEKLLGVNGVGLVDLALGESKYEKAADFYTVMQYLSRAQSKCENHGALEMTFVSIGLQVRQNMVVGNTQTALRLLDGFERQVQEVGNIRLQTMIDALRCRVNLMRSDMEGVQRWMQQQAPDENCGFCTLERYRYLTKVRCYIAMGMEYDALMLMERMKPYVEMSQRHYIHMEIGILSAIAKQRLNMPWKEEMLQTLKQVQEYQFIRLISEEGAAILPLLKEIRQQYLTQPNAWFKDVVNDTEMVARRYPGYQCSSRVKLSDFSDTALVLLRMQANGLSIKEIAAELGISERTAKYHAAENYRKLGAKGKTDAVQIARSLNIL